MSGSPVDAHSWSGDVYAEGIPTWALDDVPFGIGILTVPDLKFVYSNRLYESWYAEDRRPIVGKRLDEALSAAPQVASVFTHAAERGRPVHFHDAEFVGLKNRPIVMPGDVTRWDWSIWPLKDTQGRTTHLLVSGYDVTGPAVDRLRLTEAHEEGVRALIEVSRVAGAAGSIEDFFGELSRTVARLVGARKVLFTRVVDGSMAAQPMSHGFDDPALSSITVPCSPDGPTIADRIVFHDEVFRGPIGSGPEFDPYREALATLDVSDAAALAWRAGDERLGLVAAFNSARPGGFNDEDVHILRVASMAAGLVWQHRELASQLMALEHHKAEFMRYASHEMRGPINVISAYSSLLAEGSFGSLTQPAIETTRTIGAKIQELNRIVDQVLESSRLEDPTLSLELTTFDLRDIGPAALEDAQLARHPDHSVKITMSPDAVYVRSDRDRVAMIVGNLLDNAIKYSPAGGQVVCETRRAGGSAEVRVSDEGIGIADDQLSKLFRPFSRVTSTGTEPVAGTGLGLYLCREAARVLGGEIGVESRLGEGSTFWLRLPLASRQAADDL